MSGKERVRFDDGNGNFVPAVEVTGKKVINIPGLRTGVLPTIVIGTSPLISHAWAPKSIGQMLDKQLKQAKGAREAKNPEEDFEGSLYSLADGGYGFPSIGFKAAAVTACTSVEGITKVAARQAFHILGEPIPVKMVYDPDGVGRTMKKNLVRILGSKPEMREDNVRVGMGTADIRYRGQFWPWYAHLRVSYNLNVLSEGQILNIINTSGFGVGIGEWRPERDGENGMFRVASEADKQIITALEQGNISEAEFVNEVLAIGQAA